MGETPRKSPNHINGWARSSDVRSLLKGCDADWLWTLLAHDEQKRDNINFALGTATHMVPEEVLGGGMDLESAIGHAVAWLDAELATFVGDPIRGKRSLNGAVLARNVDRMARQWYKDIIEDDPFPGYDVAVEMNVVYEDVLRTQLDALYSKRTDTNGMLFDIVDWKTGTRSKADDMQLHIYEWGLRKNGTIEDGDAVQGWFYFPWNGDWQKAKPYPGTDVVQQWIDTTFERKRDAMNSMGTPVPDWYCDYCAVQESLCPVFRDGSWQAVEELWKERQPVLVDMDGEHIG